MPQRPVDQRLKKQTQKKNRPRPPEDEETEAELEYPPIQFLNRQKSVFDTDAGNRTKGINTAPSVFERTAVFHTKEEE